MKTKWAIIIVLGLVACTHFVHWHHWTVKPAANGLWRECLQENYPFDRSESCGSPMSYDEALWWTQTEGGDEVQP